MTADAFIVHLTPRRVRVKIPSKRGMSRSGRA